MKAILISKNITFPKTHNLIYLLDLLSDFIKIEEQKYNQAIILNNFGVEVRYPNQTIHLSDIELKEAIKTAEEFRQFAIDLIYSS